jgi:hypothetical protein
MENNVNSVQEKVRTPEEEKERETKIAIQKKVLHLERVNYAAKPDNLKDSEMVSRIKDIIQKETDK